MRENYHLFMTIGLVDTKSIREKYGRICSFTTLGGGKFTYSRDTIRLWPVQSTVPSLCHTLTDSISPQKHCLLPFKCLSTDYLQLYSDNVYWQAM